MLKKLIRALMPRSWRDRYYRIVVVGIRQRTRRFLVSLYLVVIEYIPFQCRQKSILRKVESKVYSQNGEDGILEYIFSKIGASNRTFVEIGVQDGRECNTANLSIHRGWKGVLIEGGEDFAKRAKTYYESRDEIAEGQVVVRNCYVTKENINSVLAENQTTGMLDLLSIDIDGNDYWIWEALSAVTPRVVVIEYNATFEKELSVTVQYDPMFARKKKHPSGLYHGASLRALTKLAKMKGYLLVGCDSSGCNAFYVRQEDARGRIDMLPVEKAYYPHSRRLYLESTKRQFERIRHLELVVV